MEQELLLLIWILVAFAIDGYSVHGLEGSTDRPAVNSGSMILEFLSGDPAKECIWPCFHFILQQELEL